MTTASEVAVTPTGGISSNNAQSALAELDTKKAATSSLASVALSGAGVDLIGNIVAWTPVLTFATPGDLAVSYTTQLAFYQQITTRCVLVSISIVTSSFTFTTASGALQITGVPFTTNSTAGIAMKGGLQFGGINKASYSQVALGIPVNSSTFVFNASGMGVSPTGVTASDTPTGGTVTINAEILIFI